MAPVWNLPAVAFYGSQKPDRVWYIRQRAYSETGTSLVILIQSFSRDYRGYGRHAYSSKRPSSFLHINVSSCCSCLIYRGAQDTWRYGLSDWFLRRPALISINLARPLVRVRHQMVQRHIFCHVTWCGGVTRFIPAQLPTGLLWDSRKDTGMWACTGDVSNDKHWKCGFILEKNKDAVGPLGIVNEYWLCAGEKCTLQPCSAFVSEGNFCSPRLGFQVLHLYSLSPLGCWISNAFFVHKSLTSELQFI